MVGVGQWSFGAAWKCKKATKTVGTVFAASFAGFCEVAEGGLEPPPKSAGKTDNSETGAALSGAVDNDLEKLIKAWPDLPTTTKAEIMAMVCKGRVPGGRAGAVDF